MINGIYTSTEKRIVLIEYKFQVLKSLAIFLEYGII